MRMMEINIESILERIRDVSIGVVGDFCLDAYKFLDFSASETSIETGLPTKPVRDFRFSLGGAGNVAANLASLGVGRDSCEGGVYAIGVIGDDAYGREMELLMQKSGIDTRHLYVQPDLWDTHVYMKMYDGDEEVERFDFGLFNIQQEETRSKLIDALKMVTPTFDALIINQQLAKGLHTEEFRRELSDIIRQNPGTIFITDSRNYNCDFKGTIRKLNDKEAAALCFPGKDDVHLEKKETVNFMATELYSRWGKPVILTRGDCGCLVCTGEGIHEIPGLHITSRIDIVGAGDSMLAGLTAALAAGEYPHIAAMFGNFTAGVTVQKLRQTGTAVPEEIRSIGTDPDFRYNPEIAAAPRNADYLQKSDGSGDSEIEIIENPPFRNTDNPSRRYTHAIFDHDGTISVLRQGWEHVMESTMMEIILDKHFKTAGDKEYQRINGIVREFIEKTTGIQTLSQMRSLVQLVKECGYAERVRNEHEYKSIYNERLMEMVDERIRNFQSGEQNIADYTIKKAVDFLQMLRNRGLMLYLASGTDQSDVEREARLLGYSDMFNGGIYGAVGRVEHEPKKVVLQQIISDIQKKGKAEAAGSCNILTFGDGPVELRETRKRGGFAIGVASDEIRRHGFNQKKRERLVLAGAHLIIPDFSQMDILESYLFGGG